MSRIGDKCDKVSCDETTKWDEGRVDLSQTNYNKFKIGKEIINSSRCVAKRIGIRYNFDSVGQSG